MLWLMHTFSAEAGALHHAVEGQSLYTIDNSNGLSIE